MKLKLSEEQSAMLVWKGVDAKLASDSITTVQAAPNARGIIKLPNARPIFLLTDILQLLPKTIENGYYRLEITVFKDGEWSVCYILTVPEDSVSGDMPVVEHDSSSNELIDAIYDTFNWLIDNNHLKLNGE